jgi:carbon starvation protein
MVGALCVLALAYRFYSKFLAARVLVLDDLQRTPAHARVGILSAVFGANVRQ